MTIGLLKGSKMSLEIMKRKVILMIQTTEKLATNSAHWLNKNWSYVPAEKQSQNGVLVKWLAEQNKAKLKVL
jgi:hypothetical protein